MVTVLTIWRTRLEIDRFATVTIRQTRWVIHVTLSSIAEKKKKDMALAFGFNGPLQGLDGGSATPTNSQTAVLSVVTIFNRNGAVNSRKELSTLAVNTRV